MSFTTDEVASIGKISPIAQGNATEYLCVFLLKHLQNNLQGLEIKSKTIKEIILTHYNFGGAQKCDLKIEIRFNDSEIQQSIYIESKSYIKSDDTTCSNSVEGSVVEFIKKPAIIGFGDCYMVFIPGNNNLNNIEFLTQCSRSKDCNFPRYFFQISGDSIQMSELLELVKKINDATGGGKKLTHSELNDIYDNLKGDNCFNNVYKRFSNKVLSELNLAFDAYLKDIVFESECYEKYYEKPDLSSDQTSQTQINNIANMFDCGSNNITDWANSAKKFCTIYLGKKHGYLKYPNILETIYSRELGIFEEIIEDICCYDYLGKEAFDKQIIENIHSISTPDYKPFIERIICTNASRKGFFYLQSNINNYKITYNTSFKLAK